MLLIAENEFLREVKEPKKIIFHFNDIKKKVKQKVLPFQNLCCSESESIHQSLVYFDHIYQYYSSMYNRALFKLILIFQVWKMQRLC